MKAAMTFGQIGAELGVTGQLAQQIYQTAVRKLRRNPEGLQSLVELADLLERERAARASGQGKD